MDSNHSHLVSGGLPEKKATKIAKTMKKPMKVVYISNPMKFKTSASEFRALVQELTGQDSELPDPTKFVGCDDQDHDVGGNDQAVPNYASKTAAVVADGDGDGGGGDDDALENPTKDPSKGQPERKDDAPFESFDDDFVPQMLENISGIMPWYEAC